uniref:Uncharacterized protein n=1 Tax=Salix viminalis TaxID=40686 RepID=A0A6N2MXM6_SALVM
MIHGAAYLEARARLVLTARAQGNVPLTLLSLSIQANDTTTYALPSPPFKVTRPHCPLLLLISIREKEKKTSSGPLYCSLKLKSSFYKALVIFPSEKSVYLCFFSCLSLSVP